jgi:hypothetical protein
MKEGFIKILIAFAIILIILGFLVAFLDLQVVKIEIKNDGYVAALFSLAGVFLFGSALMYQIKEYKLQLTEFKKSVEAQTKSSEALEEQKQILIEQNINNLIFGMINNFNDFRDKNKIQKAIDEVLEKEQCYYALRWENNQKELRLNRDELNRKFAGDIKSMLTHTIGSYDQYPLLKQYIQFIYNIFFIIDQNKPHLSKDYFTSFLHIQLTKHEKIFLCLANLVDSKMPQYDSLYWGLYETETITNWIKACKHGQHIDYKEIDNHVLTDQFKLIKQ